MRTQFFNLILILAATASLLIAGCSPEDNNVNVTPTVITENLQSGGWVITSFTDSGKNETGHFNGYIFQFESNGILTASDGSNSVQGQWSITDNSSGDDSPDDIDFNIFFNLSNSFEELNEDWHIVSQSADKIELIHISGGNGGTDLLTFEKG